MVDATRSLVAATASSRFTVPNYWADAKTGVSYSLQVQVPQARMQGAEDLLNLPISSTNGRTALLRSFAKVTEGSVVGEYDRYNMARTISVTANIHGSDLGTAARLVDAALKELGTPLGTSVVVRGQVQPLRELEAGLRSGLVAAVAVILLLLTANFQSLRLSFIVLGTVPAVLAGDIRLGAIASLTHGAAGASRPFDTARDGFVMAEGAGVLVLEEWEHALARGAHIYGEVVGYGQSCDAGHLTSPDETGDGPARAVQAALDDAGLTAVAIGYVNAHATSTPVGDTAEARALQRAGLGQTPISSTKGQHGHTIGAAGAIEAIVTLACFARNQLPPCANLVEPDVELDLVRDARPAKPDYVMSTGFGFGGHDAALIFRRA